MLNWNQTKCWDVPEHGSKDSVYLIQELWRTSKHSALQEKLSVSVTERGKFPPVCSDCFENF